MHLSMHYGIATPSCGSAASSLHPTLSHIWLQGRQYGALYGSPCGISVPVDSTVGQFVCLQAAGGNRMVQQDPFSQVKRSRQSGMSFAPAAASLLKDQCRSWLQTTWFASPGQHSSSSLTLIVKQDQGHEEKLFSVCVKGIFLHL